MHTHLYILPLIPRIRYFISGVFFLKSSKYSFALTHVTYRLKLNAKYSEILILPSSVSYLVAIPNTCCLERLKRKGCETYPSRAKAVHDTFSKPALSISVTQSASKRQSPNKEGHMPVRVSAICSQRMKVPFFSGTCSTKMYFPPCAETKLVSA